MEINVDSRFRDLGLRHFGRMQLNTSVFIASCIFIFPIVFGGIFAYAAFISKLMPDTGNAILDYIKDDYYFCYLLPLMILPLYFLIYVNWLAMKFFENN